MFVSFRSCKFVRLQTARDAAPVPIGTHFYRHPIAGQDPNPVQLHPARRMRQNLSAIQREFNSEKQTGQSLNYNSLADLWLYWLHAYANLRFGA